MAGTYRSDRKRAGPGSAKRAIKSRTPLSGVFRHTHYTHSLGLLELREAICAHYRQRYRVELSPEQVIVTSGTSPAMFMVFSALLEPGEEVIVSNPHYACYPNFIRFAQGQPILVPVREEDGFQFYPEEVKKRIGPKDQGDFY